MPPAGETAPPRRLLLLAAVRRHRRSRSIVEPLLLLLPCPGAALKLSTCSAGPTSRSRPPAPPRTTRPPAVAAADSRQARALLITRLRCRQTPPRSGAPPPRWSAALRRADAATRREISKHHLAPRHPPDCQPPQRAEITPTDSHSSQTDTTTRPGAGRARTAALLAAVHHLLSAPPVQRLPALARAHLPPAARVAAEAVGCGGRWKGNGR